MTTTSSVSSTSAPSVSTGNAQDVSSLTSGSVTLSLAEAVTTKVQPYLDQASAIQTEINTNNTQVAAYQNMQSLLTALQTAASNLTTESLEGTNVFQSRAANLSSSGSTAASSILSAAVADGTASGTHTVVVNQLAASEADTSATLALTSSAAISTLTGSTFNGSITIAENGKTSPQAVTISSSMTLSQVAAAINGASTSNGVTASVVSVDASHQVLVLSAADADTPINFTDSNSILQALGVVSGSSSSTMTGTTASPTGLAGSFTIHGGSATAAVTFTGGESVSAMAAAINSAAGASSEIQASVTAGNQLQITDSAGHPLSFSDISGSALSSTGISPVPINQVTAAQAANLTVDGVKNIMRTSNTVSDVLTGVTLNLTQADPNTTVTVNIAPNANTAASAIQSFVTAYNGWESFVQQNEATSSSGGAAASAVLFGDSSLRDASLQVDNAITQEVNGTSLGALGISLDSNNQMQVDATTLDNALNNNFDTVANLFQATLTSSSVNLQPSGTNMSSFTGTITFGITMSGSNISTLTATSGGQNVASQFLFAGTTIQGAPGTPYAGMYLNYTGTGETATVTSSQGLANQVYTVSNNFASPTEGSLETLISGKQSQNLQFTSQYNNWINEANDYSNFLLTQYSSLTTQIQSAGETLTTLTALMNASNSSS
jgi:flagellar hook-associated protein 2